MDKTGNSKLVKDRVNDEMAQGLFQNDSCKQIPKFVFSLLQNISNIAWA